MKGSSAHNRDEAPMDIIDSGRNIESTSDMEEEERYWKCYYLHVGIIMSALSAVRIMTWLKGDFI